MPKPAKNQWDFGELFPQEAVRQVRTVTELTGQIKRLLEAQVGSVWVSGEISNFRAQSSGHIYFTLKDAGAQLACVLFRGQSSPLRDALRDGQKVLLQGGITVYEARGQHQLVVSAIELQGVGALQLAFERLKVALAAEGLFATERKRALPRFPQRLGLVSSPTGAAIRDVLHVLQRRQPGLEIIFAPCRVQGQGAAAEIAAAIRDLNSFSTAQPHGGALDLVLVTRGGGSLEDLWAFNEEAVARAIFESALPVVSAVGHEIDFTIADFVADFRAATPSAAAEVISEGAFASREFVASAARQIVMRAEQRLVSKRNELAAMRHRLGLTHPRRRFQELVQRVDDATISLLRNARAALRKSLHRAQRAALRLRQLSPAAYLARQGERQRHLSQRLRELTRQRIRNLVERHAAAVARLRLLSPEQVLARGYSITRDARTGEVLRSAEQVRSGQRLQTRLSRGEIGSVVED